MKKAKTCYFSWIILALCLFHTTIIQAELLTVQNKTGDTGEEVTVTISVSNAANSVKAFGFDIIYDSSVLEFNRYVPGTLLTGYTFYDAIQVDTDRIRVGAVSANSSRYIHESQSGNLIFFKFDVLESKTSDIEIVNLKDEILNWETQNGEFKPADQPSTDNIYYRFKRLWPSLKQPWYFYHPMDIAVDSQKFVYIADTWNDRIQKYSTTGQAVTKWGSNGTSDGMFQTPISIAVYNNSNQTFLFVVDQLNHRIQKFTGNGEFITKWGGQGESLGKFQMPCGIAIDNEGAVYVADTGNSRIQKFSLDGIYQQEWTSMRNAHGKMFSPYAICVDKKNNIYVTDIDSNCVIKFSNNGKLLHFFDKWGPYTTNHFYKPTGIDIVNIDNQEVIIVSDNGNDRILTFLPDGKLINEHEYISKKLRLKLNSPSGIATDEKGKIFIADTLNNRVVQIQIRPEISVNKWASQGIQNGYFIRPRGIFFQKDRLLVSSGASYDSHSNHFIQSFSSNGEFIEKWPKSSDYEDHFNIPSGIVADDDFYYVLDSGNHKILQYNIDGTLNDEWGNQGHGPGELKFPTGIALYQEFVFVADTGNHRIQVFHNDGSFIDEWGEMGSEIGDFLIPKDLAIDNSGNIYVSDTGNHRIQKFSENGDFISQWGGFGSLNGELNSPSGIAIQADNSNIVVADTGNHRCQVFSPYGKYIGKFGEYGSFAGQFNEPFHIAIDSDNNIYVTDHINNRVQKFQPISMGDGIAKAIIMVGDDTYGDALFQTNANLAYRSLNYQGFGKNDIYYLSKDTDMDLDDNGLADDVDALASNINLKNAVLEWANGAEHVIIYLIGHNDLYFRSNATEVLNNNDLDLWMDQLQIKTNCKITFIYDACKSGNYLGSYAAPENYSRVVITSTGPDENAYLIGAISFSNYFWTHIFNGHSVQNAFNMAATTTAQINQPPYMATPQNPLMDADGNGIGNEIKDYNLTQNLFLGNATDNHFETIKITEVSDPQTITDGTSAFLKAQVVSEKSLIKNVWAVIRRPDYQSGASEAIDIQLSSVGSNNFEGIYQGFETPGTYLIAFYAQDENGNICLPQFSTVSVNSPMYRRAVIVIGESSDYSQTTFFEQTATRIYDSLIFQGYTDETIYIISPTVFTQGWDAGINLNNINYALGQWTQTPEKVNTTQDLLICFLGITDQNNFIVNSNEKITSESLNNRISLLENQIPGKIVVICDTPNAWGFMSTSAQSNSNNRILIASSSVSESATFVSENTISFSVFFWQRVFNGFNVQESFRAAKDALNILNQYQSPCLDADGDGDVNQYNDYAEAQNFTIGFGIMQAQDMVTIAQVMPPTELSGTTNVFIWAKKITSTSAIDRVWAIIIPPDLKKSTEVIDHLPQIELIYNQNSDQYEADYNAFNLFGKYRIAIYASSTNGITSDPAETSLYQTNMPDSFESFADNEIDNSQIININDTEPQRHNFHKIGDRDWVKFYAISGNIYRIFTNNADLNCDPVITLYDQSKAQIISANDGVGSSLEELVWRCPEDGVYYVEINNYDSESYGENTGYDLRINTPATIFNGIINGYVKNANTNVTIGNALIRTSINLTDISLPDIGTYRIGGHESGTFQIFAEKSGFFPYSASINVGPISITRHDIYMQPSDLPGDLNTDGSLKLDDAILGLQVITKIETLSTISFAADISKDGRIGIEELIYILVEKSEK